MNVAFVSADWVPRGAEVVIGGSGWYRCAMPARWLHRAGHRAVVAVDIAVKPDGEICPIVNDEPEDGFDIIIFQRWMNQDAPDVIAGARSAGQLVINDVDDWYWGLDPRNRAASAISANANPISNIKHYGEALRASAALFVSTPFLARALEEKFHVPTVLLRNAVDISHFEETRKARRGRPYGPPVRVGWVGATPWRSGDLEELQGVLQRFTFRDDVRFYHGGTTARGPSFAQLTGLPASRVDTRPMRPIEDYPSLFEPIDVGVVPLRECDFNEAKSCIKGLEYAAAGVPFIASPSGEYSRLCREYDIGRTARRPKQWIKQLDELIHDEALREYESARNLERLLPHDIAVRGQDWEKALLDL